MDGLGIVKRAKVETKNGVHQTWWQLVVHRLASTRLGAKLFSVLLPPLDRWVLRVSKGRTSIATVMAGLPIITLITVGAKSGTPRSVPLVGIPAGQTFVLIASNWGQTKHPAWYLNLRANPQVKVSVANQIRPYTAREATPEEYKAYWAQAVALYAGYAAYLKTAGTRHIPIVILTPVSGLNN